MEGYTKTLATGNRKVGRSRQDEKPKTRYLTLISWSWRSSKPNSTTLAISEHNPSTGAEDIHQIERNGFNQAGQWTSGLSVVYQVVTLNKTKRYALLEIMKWIGAPTTKET